MKVRIVVTLKPGVLDPQGKAIHKSLESLGFDGVNDVRAGKVIELDIADSVTDDELDMQAALLAIDAGERIDGDMVRHLVGAGFAHCTSTRVMVTDAGRDFLAQLVATPPQLDIEARA